MLSPILGSGDTSVTVLSKVSGFIGLTVGDAGSKHLCELPRCQRVKML